MDKSEMSDILRLMFTLKAEKRDVFGKKLAKRRAAGLLPIVMYGGPKEPSASYFVNAADFQKIFRETGESSIISVETSDGTKEALVQDTDRDPVSGALMHVDLYVIERGKPIEVTVPLVFTGVAPAVKNLGGILVKVMHELEIEVLPKDIPHEITVDVSKLETMDSQILVKDLALPPSAKPLLEPDETVAAISEQVEEVEEATPAPDFSQIEVEKKGKKEEEEPAAE